MTHDTSNTTRFAEIDVAHDQRMREQKLLAPSPPRPLVAFPIISHTTQLTNVEYPSFLHRAEWVEQQEEKSTSELLPAHSKPRSC